MGCSFSVQSPVAAQNRDLPQEQQDPRQEQQQLVLEARSFDRLRNVVRKVWGADQQGAAARLAEIENQSSSTLVFFEKNREVWRNNGLFKLEPLQKLRPPPDCRVLHSRATYECVEVLVMRQGKQARAAPPIRIEPYDLLKCKRLIIRGNGIKLELIRVP